MVINEHPRLMFRNSEWEGLTIDELRDRCKDPDYNCSDITNEGIAADAMRWVIEEDSDIAEVVRLHLLGDAFTCNDSVEYVNLPGYSLAFDWIYNYENFSEPEKSFVNKKIKDCAWELNTLLNTEAPNLFHGRTQLTSELMVAALAQDGDKALFEQAKQKFFDSLEAWQYLDGAWPEGMNYLRNRMGGSGAMETGMSDALLSFYSATGFNIFDYIKYEQGDWLQRIGLFHVFMLRPDGQWSRFGEMPGKRFVSHGEFTRHLELIASMYQNSYVQGLVQKFDF